VPVTFLNYSDRIFLGRYSLTSTLLGLRVLVFKYLAKLAGETLSYHRSFIVNVIVKMNLTTTFFNIFHVNMPVTFLDYFDQI